MTSFAPQLGFPKDFCSISFSLINGCLIENALCSDIVRSKIAIGRDPRDRTIPVSAYNKIIFFPPFLFFNHGKGETNKPLGSKKQSFILWNEIIEFYLNFICESDTNSGVWNRRVGYVSINLLDNVCNFFLYSGYFLRKNLRELRAMAFCDEILWKLLSDLPAPVLFPLANDRFSVSANFFRYKIDSFSLEYKEYLGCMITSFPFHHEW